MRPANVLRAAVAVTGAALMAFGVYGLLHDPFIHDPLDVLTWALGGALLHDGLWLPLVCLAGAALSKAPWTVRGGLLVASTLTAVGLPAALHAGQRGNPTVLPLPYRSDLLWLLAATAASTLLLEGLMRARRAGRWPTRPRRGSRRSPGPSGDVRRR